MTCMIQLEHTHMHVYAWIPPIKSKWLVQRHVMNRSRSVLGECMIFDARATSMLWNGIQTCMHASPPYICICEQVHLTQCQDFLVSEARATSKLWNWLFKHHTTPLWATCMQAVVILARTLTCDDSICGPMRPSSMHASLWPTSGEVN